ncbi:hypothetical protein TSUD_95640 [Trifolium subterraneum]|uniref:Uncharacterized protein n=1 Tax=Trifolium subterraneum TaxID=3900 RepID=A0A2Z6LNW6_TRISU|nr:hypothetical protein TSUD_95640 [Trifolium subterraneum]
MATITVVGPALPGRDEFNNDKISRFCDDKQYKRWGGSICYILKIEHPMVFICFGTHFRSAFYKLTLVTSSYIIVTSSYSLIRDISSILVTTEKEP